VVRLVVFALVLGLASSDQVEAGAPATGTRFEHVLDLTHTLDGAFPYIPVPGITFPFRLKPIATLEANGVAANSWEIHEHLGTQIDAPNHFAKGGRSLDQLRADELIVPVIVIDISERAQNDADAVLTVRTSLRGKRGMGACRRRLRDDAFRLAAFHAADPARFIGRDAQGVLHFPAYRWRRTVPVARASHLGRRRRHDLDRSGWDHTYQTPPRAARRR
jgi:hypothetical protein